MIIYRCDKCEKKVDILIYIQINKLSNVNPAAQVSYDKVIGGFCSVCILDITDFALRKTNAIVQTK